MHLHRLELDAHDDLVLSGPPGRSCSRLLREGIELTTIRRLTLAVLCTLAGTLALSGTPALAGTKYVQVSSFGSGGVLPDSPLGLGLEQATGEVFVADGESVQRFAPVNRAHPSAGYSLGSPLVRSFTSAIGVGVDDSGGLFQGDVYVADEAAGVVDKFEASGLPDATHPQFGAGATPLALSAPTDAVVDPADGDVYVSDYNNNVVDIFTPTGGFLSQFATGSGPLGLAFNSTGGDLYVTAANNGEVEEYDASGDPIDQTAGPDAGTNVVDADGSAGAVAVDTSTDEVYVYEDGGNVAVYESSGAPLSQLGFDTGVSFSLGIAVDPATHTVFISDPNGRVVDVFQTLSLPAVSTEQATGVTATGATLEGTVNPEGQSLTSCELEYGTSSSYGQSVPCQQTTTEIGSGSTPVPVSATLTGLTPNTVYHYRLKASNSEGSKTGLDETFTTPRDITLETGAPSDVRPTAATFNGTVNPDGVQVTSCEFEYGTETSYGQSVPCRQTPTEIGAGSSPVAVSAEVSGLQQNTVYHFRLAAGNTNGSSTAADETFTTPGAPIVDSESVSGVGSTTATLRAQVNAVGSPTTYRFEYGTGSAYGSATQQTSLGSAQSDAGALAQLSGLQPDTVYHYRVLASNANGTTPGTDATFTTFPVAILGLPDERGYEMVSPIAGGDGEVYEPHASGANADNADNTERPFQAAADGNAMAYTGASATTSGTGEDGVGAGNQYLATRAPAGGWTAVDIEPLSGQLSEQPIYQAFSSDLSVGILSWNGHTPLAADAPGDGYHVLYTRTSSDGAYHPLLTTTPPNRSPAEFGSYEVFHQGEGSLVFAGASSNLEHNLFVANDALTANAVDGGETENNLYDSIDGQLRLVNVLPDGTSQPNAIFGSPAMQPEEAPSSNSPDFSHVISTDGTRIFWTDLSNGNLYVRENGVTTVQVDAAVGGGGRFWTASADGSKVFFTKAGDLYEYNLGSGQTTDLAPAGEVQGVIGASEDGSYLYFVAKGALAPGATPQVCEPANPSTGCNLYVLHEGKPLKFIAKLSGADDSISPFSLGKVIGDWRPGLGDRTAKVTPDGRHLVFMSQQSLTGYENMRQQEVYVYDADANQLSCVSCNPSGEPPTSGHEYLAYLPPSWSNTYQPRWISEAGSRVFFDSVEALAPQDTNGQLDVYEWEQDGTGSCRHGGGCIYLLSGGTSSENSYFADASVSGDDVFIITRAQLAPQDKNEDFDVYDVRVGTVQPLSPATCSGVGCQAAPPEPPVFGAPSSEAFSGAGNLAPPATVPVSVKPKQKPAVCKKGFVKKHGKCIKRKAKKKAKKSARGRK
jgi:DNA-binding beta-propeller fold protein YncE